jgi:3-hydroxyisobutyrate dehydrogenase
MKICWIGLGHMGFPMATHLHASGFQVHAFDVSSNACAAAMGAGLRVADSVVDAATDAGAVFTMLPTGADVQNVLVESGLLRSTAADALIIDSSTISTAEVRSIAAAVESAGRNFIDAPVSGGTAGARDGTLTFMVGGSVEHFERARPLLEPMASRLFHLGETGCGQSAKAVNNMLLAVNMAGVSEAAVLAQRLGLDARTFFEVVKVSSGDSWVLRSFYPIPGVIESSPASHDFAPGFTARLMRKDVALALDAADEHHVDTAMTRRVADLLDRLIAAGQGDLDFSALVRIAEGEFENDTVGVPS